MLVSLALLIDFANPKHRNMKSFVYLAVAAAAFTSAQDASSTSELVTAETTVPASVVAAPSLFEGETLQLTDAVLADVSATLDNASISDLFAFESNSTLATRSTRSCKLMPGDSLWPIPLIWSIFDILVGGRLIKATPIASVCYKEWPEYDAAECATLNADWLISDTQ